LPIEADERHQEDVDRFIDDNREELNASLQRSREEVREGLHSSREVEDIIADGRRHHGAG
jgi:hypothetical protein